MAHFDVCSSCWVFTVLSKCVCLLWCVQVVCEKGLGVNGITLSSLNGEGFKAVFIGIGELNPLIITISYNPR